MLHRMVDGDLVVITQPAHAWISGQLASVWGNDELGLDVPDRVVQLAAEQHDIAWLDWEAAPTLNRDTGLPRAFSELPTLEHLAVWDHATRRALVYGRYPALLISMHGTYLYRRFHDFDADSSAEAVAARAFIEREQAFQDAIAAEVVRDGVRVADEIGRDRRLVSLWDAMSLSICMGIEGTRQFDDVPTRDSGMALRMEAREASPARIALSPWPLRSDNVLLRCEGRRIEGTFDDEDSMRTALSAAPVVSLVFELTPA